jgi:hypothetical protein
VSAVEREGKKGQRQGEESINVQQEVRRQQKPQSMSMNLIGLARLECP